MDEGVIKFQLRFTPGSLPDRLPLAELIAWQRIMHRLGLLGRDPARYGGLAYGNLSRRLPGMGFVVSASQAADHNPPTAQGYCLVTAWDCAGNRLTAEGPSRPSSESLTHAALYDADPAIGCIIHGHSPEIWQRRGALGLATTRPEVTYGTPEMASEMIRLYREHGFHGRGVLAMGGHQDGIVSFGRTCDDAGGEMVRALREALTLG